MSKRIEHLLAVLQHIFTRYSESEQHISPSLLRIEAAEEVAASFGVRTQTVQDIFVRRLRPRSKNTDESDRLIGEWLRSGADDLRKAALGAACDRRDEEAIDSFFKRHTRRITR